jgi:hypothetical protein
MTTNKSGQIHHRHHYSIVMHYTVNIYGHSKVSISITMKLCLWNMKKTVAAIVVRVACDVASRKSLIFGSTSGGIDACLISQRGCCWETSFFVGNKRPYPSKAHNVAVAADR